MRLFWNEEFSQLEFVIGMANAIDRGYRQAWRVGAAECGIRPQDYTVEEERILQQLINDQFPYITSLGTDIADKTRPQGGQLAPLYRRTEVWVQRYEEVRNQAKMISCKNAPLEWVLGVAEHCISCIKLAGKVKRARTWRASGVWPRQAGSDLLECRGYNCKCSLVRTTKPITPGPLPRLP